jgi:hypothetical protein
MSIERIDLILAVCGLISAAVSALATFWVGQSSTRQREIGRAILAQSFSMLSEALADEKRSAERETRRTRKPLGNRRAAR